MRWGMPTLVEYPDLERNVRLCKQLGLQFVEINMNLPMFQAGNLERIEPDPEVGFTIHLDEQFDPANFNEKIADAYLDTLRQTIRAAKKLNVPTINLHMTRGVHFKLPGEIVYLYERYRERYLDKMLEMRSVCEREAGDIIICIENTDGYLDFQKEAVGLLLESPTFCLTWDIGHSHTAKVDDVPFLTGHLGNIKHFHIHDALGARCHLSLGEGEIDLNRMLNLAKDCGATCVLETKTAAALEQSVGWLRESGHIL